MVNDYLAPGTLVDIEFLPSFPNLARLKGGFFVPGGMLEVFWSAMFVALPLFGLWNYLRWRGGRLELLRHGVCVAGYIERAWRDNPKTDTRGWIEISYPTSSGTIRLNHIVNNEAIVRAFAILEGTSVVQILHATDTPRDHLILDLMD